MIKRLMITAAAMAVLPVLALMGGGASPSGATFGNHNCAHTAETGGTSGVWAYETFTAPDSLAYIDITGPSGTGVEGACVQSDNGTVYGPYYTGNLQDSCFKVSIPSAGGGAHSLSVQRLGSVASCGHQTDADVLINGHPSTGNTFLQGDTNCDQVVNATDSLNISRFVSALDVTQTEPCPWGSFNWYNGWDYFDVQCDGDIDSVDALMIQRWKAGLSVTQSEPCTDIGVLLP